MKLGGIGLLAAALVLATTAGHAQTSKGKTKKMTQAQQIEARQQCFLEAQAQVPGAAIGGGEMSQRTAIYTACAARKGVRP
jgi:hypothetical protein